VRSSSSPPPPPRLVCSWAIAASCVCHRRAYSHPPVTPHYRSTPGLPWD